MKTLTFKLSGETGFFKQPDVNTYQYFTYGNIHKIALLGILGSILGLGGYHQQKKDEDYPEFYEKLKHLQIAIRPLNEQGYIPKKVQIFNNSVGYASKEEGGNLIVKEQWLENPAWQIYLLLENLEELPLLQTLKSRLIEKRFVYLPYLGKNDHYANVEAVETLSLRVGSKEVEIPIHSLFPKCLGELMPDDGLGKDEPYFKYEEQLPIALDPVCNQYQTKPLIFTNIPVHLSNDVTVYGLEEKNLIFF